VSTTTSFLDQVAAILQDDGWPVERDPAVPRLIRTAFAGSSATWPCEARVFEEQGQIVFDSILPEQVAPDRRAESCYLLARANWEILTGSFLIHLDAGELRFRTSVLCRNDQAAPRDVVLGMLYANVLTVDRCLDDLLAMVRGDVSPDEALERLAL
jgi:hypothetical protein